jgi:hypothetical protein
MLLSEKFSNRIKLLSGILLENKNEKLVKLGFSEEFASYLNDIGGKYAMVLGDWSVKQYTKDHNIDKSNIKDIFPLINQNAVIDYIKNNETTVNTIMEWLKFPNRPQVDLKQIKNLEEALDKAIEWHESLTATGVIVDESGEIIKTYPEGYYWIDLKTNSSMAEKDAMGHCGTDSLATTLFSLRNSKTKEPHVTIAYNEKTGNITQVKGKQNKKPVEKYMKYVIDLLKQMKAEGKFKGFRWSYPVNGPDLSVEDQKGLYTPKELFFMKKQEIDNSFQIGNIWGRRRGIQNVNQD